MSSKNRLLTEILRPQNVKQLIVPPRIEKILGDGELKMNLLLTGNAGAGKTSAAKAIASNYPYLYINCSDESGVDVIRDKIKTFCSTISVFDSAETMKAVILDECLHEEEKVRIGTIEKWESVSLSSLERGVIYNCVSMNIETGELENDTCEIISEKDSEIYEVELEDGRTLRVTDNHPFMINNSGINEEKSILEGLNTNDYICVFD